MIVKKSYRVRTLPEKHSFERFGYQYQPVLIEGVKRKQSKTDFLGLRCLEISLPSVDPSVEVFVLNHQLSEFTRNRFNLESGCKLILQESLFECVNVVAHEEETYHPAVLVKRLPYKECYKEPFADYLNSFSNI